MNRHTTGAVIRLVLTAALLVMGPVQGVFAAESPSPPAATGVSARRLMESCIANSEADQREAGEQGTESQRIDHWQCRSQ